MISQGTVGKWYFGWNIVAAAATLTLLSVGLRLGIGPFFLPIAHDLGFSRSLLASIVAVGMLAYGLAMPVAGLLVARHGTRFVLVLGTCIVAIASVWTVMAREPVGFMLSFGVLLSIGLAFVSPVALTPVISKWFTRRRGQALFFLSTGSMAGMAIMTPVLTGAIAAVGWRSTLIGFSGALALVAIPAVLWIVNDRAPEHTDLSAEEIAAKRASPPPPFEGPSLREAMRTGPFWLVFLGLFACGFSMNLLGTHGMPMLMDHGFDAGASSMGIGLIGFVAIAGTLMIGRLADRLARRKLLALIYCVRGLGFFALMVVGTHFELYLAASIGGLVWAGSIALSSAILADVYGVRLVGVLYGIAYVGHQIGGTASAWLGGWGYERWGTHWVAFGASGILLLIAAGVALRLPATGVTWSRKAQASAA